MLDKTQTVRFVNRQDAYNDAIRKFPEFKDVAGKDSFPASFIVKLNNPNSTRSSMPPCRASRACAMLNEKDSIDRLFAVLDGLRDAAFAVALVQAVGAILLIANMVQVAAYTRRTEIGIMRLVGASRWYTQLPFLVEAMLAASVGVAIAVLGLMLVRACSWKCAEPDLPSSSDRQGRLRRHPLYRAWLFLSACRWLR